MTLCLSTIPSNSVHLHPCCYQPHIDRSCLFRPVLTTISSDLHFLCLYCQPPSLKRECREGSNQDEDVCMAYSRSSRGPWRSLSMPLALTFSAIVGYFSLSERGVDELSVRWAISRVGFFSRTLGWWLMSGTGSPHSLQMTRCDFFQRSLLYNYFSEGLRWWKQ